MTEVSSLTVNHTKSASASPSPMAKKKSFFGTRFGKKTSSCETVDGCESPSTSKKSMMHRLKKISLNDSHDDAPGSLGSTLRSSKSSSGSVDDPPRKKSSIKENIANAIRSPNFLLKRESTKMRWNAMREKMKSSSQRHDGDSRQSNGDSCSTNGDCSQGLSASEWQVAFGNIITHPDGRAAFTKFLQSEYAEENILFWWAVEELKTIDTKNGRDEFEKSAYEMYRTFVASESPLAINIDHDTRTDIIDRVDRRDVEPLPDNIYERAQGHVYRLMEKDCFSRFVHTATYREVAKKLSLPQSFRFNGRLSPAC